MVLNLTNSKPIKSRIENKKQEDKILCPHCKRSKDNGISCIGMCVADSDY